MVRHLSLKDLGLTDEQITEETEHETEELISELVNLPLAAQTEAIRALPMSLGERRSIRNRVISLMLSKKSRLKRLLNCCQRVSRFFRRFRASVASVWQSLGFWQETMKDIGGRFGTSVLSYFRFLKWLLMFNIFSLLINFCFITIPQIIHGTNITHTKEFTGLELLTGVGYFNQTVFFYGGYDGEIIYGQPSYNLQLAYLFTMSAYMVICGLTLIYSMAKSFRRNFMTASGPSYGSAWRLLCSWDFSVVNVKVIQRYQANLSVQLKETLSERRQAKTTVPQSVMLKQLSFQFLAWFLSLGLAAASCASLYFVQRRHVRPIRGTSHTLVSEASMLLLPVIMCLINLIIPLVYSFINKMEHYSSPRINIYVLIIRNVLLKISTLGVICFYWIESLPNPKACWEGFVGQSLYRLVVVDLIFSLFDSFFGEFLRNVIGTKLIPSLGVPEFDIATNVLKLIYSQTLGWIGVYYSPLLPVIQIIKLFIIFYVKRVSVSRNCQPPKQMGRAAQMQTVFLALLFFPSFVGALSMAAYTVWRLKPSEVCGPFRGFDTPFHVVIEWTHIVHYIKGSEWAWWIFENVLTNALFFHMSSLIVLIFAYFFWQVTKGRKQHIKILQEQIVNEGKDKTFLLNKLQALRNQTMTTRNFSSQEFTETTFFNQNWTNTLPLDM